MNYPHKAIDLWNDLLDGIAWLWNELVLAMIQTVDMVGPTPEAMSTFMAVVGPFIILGLLWIQSNLDNH